MTSNTTETMKHGSVSKGKRKVVPISPDNRARLARYDLKLMVLADQPKAKFGYDFILRTAQKASRRSLKEMVSQVLPDVRTHAVS